jgi:Rrf2 family protein
MNVLRQNTDYALRVMVNLAGSYDRQLVPARLLADQEDISYQFASKILQQLHSAGLVDSRMGPKGGFSLSKPPAPQRGPRGQPNGAQRRILAEQAPGKDRTAQGD